MACQKEVFNGVEWKIRVADGSSETLVPEAGLASRLWLGVKNMIGGLVLKVWRFLEKAWDLGVDDPRKVIHCLKVGISLTVVSLFYYTRPLYEGVGGNAMWAIMTVVVVFENTVGKSLLLKWLDVIENISSRKLFPIAGATIAKCLNRVFGTLLAGFLALGVHWIASQSGEKLEPLIAGASLFLLGLYLLTFTHNKRPRFAASKQLN